VMRQSTRLILAAVMAVVAVFWGVPDAGAAGAAERAQQPAAAPGCPALLARQLPRLQDDAPQDLCQYAGKVVLVVNTASFCGFTRQYEGLERLHARFRARGFVVLGFPSNDFGQQEPGSAKQIAEFCENTFGVRFPMFAKTRVSGPEADPLFAELTRLSGPPRWNFYKYLIGRDGKLIAHYSSLTDPMDRKIVAEIERALTAPGT
jgi:glutathione peroxidase